MVIVKIEAAVSFEGRQQPFHPPSFTGAFGDVKDLPNLPVRVPGI
jgi:hypothetical protein